MTGLPFDWIERARSAPIEDEIAARGVKLVGRVDRCGPCPQCGGRDRFAINLRKQLFLCRGCDAHGDVIALVQFLDGVDFCTAVETLIGEWAIENKPRPRVAAAAPPPDDAVRIQQALALWREAVDPRGTLVERYLASRKLGLGDDLAGDVLRWHPRIGAMLALFRAIDTGRPQAVSRTFLDREGRKIERKFLGPVKGAAVILDRFDAVLEGLHVGEGVETCMTARQWGLRPAWALGSKDAVAAFPVLSGVECLTLLQENDGGHSERACEACASRWHAARREVIINEAIGGKDLNDAIRVRGSS